MPSKSTPALRSQAASERPRRVRYVDSHTEGEPTRVIVRGGPDLGRGSLTERGARFAFHHDAFRRLVIDPPRGSVERVGALLTEPHGPTRFGAIFFNNVGTLGMCGHGSIGVAVTLGHLREVAVPSRFELDTPVGVVDLELISAHEASVRNVPSYRYRAAVRVEVPGHGAVVGDVAWGGNWFFLIDVGDERLRVEDATALTERTEAIRSALAVHGITGADGAAIDHIELCGPPEAAGGDGRNFVLCPGGAYDRSPCGTGTSAKMACLWADGRLKDGDVWHQEGILGTRFVGTAHVEGRQLTPIIRGRAFITSEGELVGDPDDPLLPRR